ncbi:acetyl esterase [Litorimonas taeanensis]|uniref:Acetyl esterase n=1 Tax=Litorimonas taeanensis TaxID=568099 RepID=A0A420WCR8_9PROT|nr:alpha/beta hydrolase [Litorimonas taeanensis]RKQ68824.1 acetyl esterase [Litorimonas taeanensis]
MITPREFAENLREKLDRLKFDPDRIYAIHNNLRRLTNQFDHPGPKMRDTLDFNVPSEACDDCDVPVRLYIPFGASAEAGPTLIYLHGGGFVTCSIESHEGIALRIANGANIRVLSVDYRLAPEHPYPAGPMDCEHVLKWALEGKGADAYGIDPKQLSIGGDSAGGNMSAYLAQKYRKDLQLQILLYPLMQLVNFKPPKPGPQDWLQLGFMALKFIDEHYVAGADPKETRLSPLFETDLKNLPPAYVLTCGLDPLRDEGKLYADNLRRQGVQVHYHHEKAMPHGFLNFSRAFPKGRTIPLDVAEFVRKYIPAGTYGSTSDVASTSDKKASV